MKPRVYRRDAFDITRWTYYEPVTVREVPPADYAPALDRLHSGMRGMEMSTPHFTDRLDSTQQLVANRDHTPALADAGRELLGNTLEADLFHVAHRHLSQTTTLEGPLTWRPRLLPHLTADDEATVEEM